MPEARLAKTREAYRLKSPTELHGPYFPNCAVVACDVCGKDFFAELWGDQKPPYFCSAHLDAAPWRPMHENAAERLKRRAFATDRDLGDETDR